MADTPSTSDTGDRLAKVIARSGLGSRRDAEGWIVEGRVTLNGKVVRSPAVNVTARDKILVDGKPLAERQGTRVWLYHKPPGLVVTEKDPEGRPTVFEAAQDLGLPRVVSIGRLDINTEGLLLLTNDGGLKRVLELPATGWLRRYRVRAFGSITQAALDKLKDGIEVEGVAYGPIEAKLESERGSNVWLELALREGKNREVKNVLGALGLQVNRLIRVSYGPFQLGDIPEGQVETVKAKVLKEQLGKRLAAEAEVDFDSPLPEGLERIAKAEARAQRGSSTVEIGKQRFRFTDREELSEDEARLTRPRQDRPGRTSQPRARLPVGRRGGEDEGEGRQIHFDDGRAPLEFKQKNYGKKGREEKTGVVPEDTDKPARKGFGDKPAGGRFRPAGEEGERRAPRSDRGGAVSRPRRSEDGGKPYRAAGSGRPAPSDKPRAPRPEGKRPYRAAPAEGGRPPRRSYGEGAGGDRPARGPGDRPARTYGEKPARSYGDKPARSYGDKPARSYGDKPSRSFGDKPAGRSGPPRAARPAREDNGKTYGRPSMRRDGKPVPKRDGAAGPRPPRSGGPRPGGARPGGARPGGKPGPRKPRG